MTDDRHQELTTRWIQDGTLAAARDLIEHLTARLEGQAPVQGHTLDVQQLATEVKSLHAAFDAVSVRKLEYEKAAWQLRRENNRLKAENADLKAKLPSRQPEA